MKNNEISFLDDTASFYRQTEKDTQEEGGHQQEQFPPQLCENSNRSSRSINFAVKEKASNSQERAEADLKKTAQFFFQTFEPNQCSQVFGQNLNSDNNHQESSSKQDEQFSNIKHSQIRNNSSEQKRKLLQEKREQYSNNTNTKIKIPNQISIQNEQPSSPQTITKCRSQPKLNQPAASSVGRIIQESENKISYSSFKEDPQKLVTLPKSGSSSKNRFSNNRISLPSDMGFKELVAAQHQISQSQQSQVSSNQFTNITNSSSIISGFQQSQQGYPSSMITRPSQASSGLSQSQVGMYSLHSLPSAQIKSQQDHDKSKYSLNNFVNLNAINNNSINNNTDSSKKNGSISSQMQQKLQSRQKIEDIGKEASSSVQHAFKLLDDSSLKETIDSQKLSQIQNSSYKFSPRSILFEGQNLQNGEFIGNGSGVLSNIHNQMNQLNSLSNQTDRIRQMDSGSQYRRKESINCIEQVQKNLLDDNLLESLKRQQVQLSRMRQQQLKNFEGLYTPLYQSTPTKKMFSDIHSQFELEKQQQQQQQQYQQQQLIYTKQSAQFHSQYKNYIQQQQQQHQHQQQQQQQSQNIQSQAPNYLLKRELSQRQDSQSKYTHPNDIPDGDRKEKHLTMESIIPEDLQYINSMNMAGFNSSSNYNGFSRKKNSNTFHSESIGNINKNNKEGIQQLDTQEENSQFKQSSHKHFYSLHQGSHLLQSTTSTKNNPNDQFSTELEKARKQIKQTISKGNSYKVLQQFPQISTTNPFNFSQMQSQKGQQLPKGGSAAYPLRKNMQLMSPPGVDSKLSLYEDMLLNQNREARTADASHQLTKMSEGKFKTFLQRKPQENILNKIFHNQGEILESRE